jgi:hypothetical protein
VTSGRRSALYGAIGLAVWFLCTLVFWAFQPLTDSVPVGIDYTLVPPRPVSVEVQCNTLFDGAAHDGSPLPTLKAQPKGAPALGFQRDVCTQVHSEAQVLFYLDTGMVVVIAAGAGWFMLRRRRASAPSQLALA